MAAKEAIYQRIDEKAIELNKREDLAKDLSVRINVLHDFIEGRCDMSEAEIDHYLNWIVSNFTTPYPIRIGEGMKILRARKNSKGAREEFVSELSYRPRNDLDSIGIGRLNKEKKSIFYGCIYFEGDGGVNVAISEAEAVVGETVNVLRSVTDSELNVWFPGIYDYVHRMCRPYFIREDIFKSFCDIYNYQNSKYSENAFMAHVLCDAFLSDIMRRENHGNLYKVTSKLLPLLEKNESYDGILYTSVKSEGSPVLALRPESVDVKFRHVSCDSYTVLGDYGYAKYKAEHSHKGVISSNLVAWERLEE